MHCQGKQHCHFYSGLPFQLGSTLKGKNLLPKEQILAFKGRPHLGRDLSSRKSKQEVT